MCCVVSRVVRSVVSYVLCNALSVEPCGDVNCDVLCVARCAVCGECWFVW